MKIKSLYILSLALLCGSVNAQELISLKSYQQKVVDYSQQLKQSRESVSAATAKRKADKTGFLPKIDFAANGSIDLTNLDDWNAKKGAYHPYTHFIGGTDRKSVV